VICCEWAPDLKGQVEVYALCDINKEVVLEPLLLLVDEDETGSAVLSNISTSDPLG